MCAPRFGVMVDATIYPSRHTKREIINEYEVSCGCLHLREVDKLFPEIFGSAQEVDKTVFVHLIVNR